MAMSGGGIRWHGPGPGGPSTASSRVSKSSNKHRSRGPMTRIDTERLEDSCIGNGPNQRQWGRYPRRSMLSMNLDPFRTCVWVLLVALLVSPFQGLGPGVAGAQCSGTTCPTTGCQCTEIGNTGRCRVDCSSTQQDLPSLNAALTSKVVGKLILRDSSISSLPNNAFQDYPNLTVLDLTNNAISTLDNNVFQPLTNLEVLKLSGNSLQTLPSDIFAGRSILRELSLAGNSLNHLDAKLFTDLVALKSLDLSDNVFTRIPFKLFKSTKSMENFPRIHEKGKDKNKTSSEDGESLEDTTHITETVDLVDRKPEIPPVLMDNKNAEALSDDAYEDMQSRNDSLFPPSNKFIGDIQESNDTSGRRQSSQGASKNKEGGGSKEQNSDEKEDKQSKDEKDYESNTNFDSAETSFEDGYRSMAKGHGFLPIESLDLSGNEWQCDCVMGQLIAWYQKLHSQTFVKNADSTTCKTPSSLANQRWTDLDVTKLPCDESALVSCPDDMARTPILFQNSFPASAATRHQCGKKCAQNGRSHGLFQQGILCFCGDTTSTCTCPSDEPDGGSSFCSKTYIPGAFKASLGFILGPTMYTSTLDNTVLSADTTVDTKWNFDDGSGEITSNGGTVYHNYLLSGVYNVSLTKVGSGSTSKWPLKVLDPLVARITAPDFSDAQKEADIAVLLDSGTDVDVRWRRYDDSGREVLGKRCEAGWRSHRIHACLQATQLTTATNFTSASQSCSDKNSHLLSISTSSEEKQIRSTLSQELSTGQKYLLNAYKMDNVTYGWRSNNKVAYFNVTMVQGGDVSDCVALGYAGLLGVACDDVQGYICKAGQVYCEHGGEEWGGNTCFVPLGAEDPLSRADAESKCQNIQGHLAMIDTSAKDQHVRSTISKSSQHSSQWWLGLIDHSVPNYFLWPGGSSLGSYAPWSPNMPLASTGSKQLCVTMQTDTSTTTWATVDCNTKMAFICEYPSGGRVDPAKTFVAGTGQMTREFHKATTLSPVSSEDLPTAQIIILPGSWFQESGRLERFRFQAKDIPPGGARFRLQVYRPICEASYILVPPGCDDLASPFATCTSSSVSCPSVPPCPPWSQYCPLSNKCLPLSTPCTCARADPATSASCVDPLYAAYGTQQTSSQQSGGYRYSAAVPLYSLVGESSLFIPDGTDDGLFVVKAESIEVQPNDILGVQFINGSRDVICDISGPGMASEYWRQSILSLHLPQNLNLQRVDVNPGVWIDNVVCNIQAVYTTPTRAVPPQNLVHKSVHTEGEYTYKATLHNPLTSIVLEKKVTMQFSILGLTLVEPNAKFAKRTPEASKMAVVETKSTIDLLWYITRGSDAYINTTLSNEIKKFSTECPLSLKGSVSQCSKSYQFHTERLNPGASGHLTTVGVTAWNMISKNSLTIDILSQERIEEFKLKEMPISEYVQGSAYTVKTTVTKGSDIDYEFEFGDGSSQKGKQASLDHVYAAPGMYAIKVTASNYLTKKVAQESLKLVKKANVNNLNIQAPTEVDMDSKFDISVTMDLVKGSSVTVLIEYGDGKSARIEKPDVQPSQRFVVDKEYRYTEGNTYIITVSVVDNLEWDGTSDIKSVPGVKSTSHTLLAWTIIKGLTISSSLACQAVGQAVTYSLAFPNGYSKTGRIIRWSYGDGNINEKPELDVTQYSYNQPQTYLVKVEVSDNNSKGNTSFSQCIETPIAGVTFGPKSSPLALSQGSSVLSKFNVVVKEGSDLKYKWTYGGQTSTKKPDEFSIRHTTPGTQKVTLLVHNNIDSIEKETTVKIIVKIQDLEITHKGKSGDYFKVDDVNEFTAEIKAGSDVTYTWSVLSPGQEHQLSDAHKTGASWSSPGTYEIQVVAENPVSKKEAKLTVTVQEPIPELIMDQFTDWKVNEPFKLGVKYSGGTAIQYAWQVCRGTCQDQQGTDRTLTYTPTEAGVYTFKVTASNKVSTAASSLDVTIWAKLTKLEIVALSLVNGWGKKGQDLVFKANLETGIATIYDWTVTDYAKNVVWTGQEEQATVNMQAEGRYTLTLRASNPTGDILETTFIFNVQEAIKNLELLALRGNVVNDGDFVDFRASYSEGSVVMYSWDILNSEGSSVDLKIGKSSEYFGPCNLNAGQYTVKLNAHNKVSDITVDLQVEIQTPDPRYNIKVHYNSDPYVHQYIPVEMSVTGFSSDPSTLIFAWSFYTTYPDYPPERSNELRASHNFTETGEFMIEARVTEGRTLTVIRKLVYVQGKLPRVTLSQQKKILATGETSSFQASLATSVPDVEYQWTVSGEAGSVKTTDGSYTHTFRHAGVIIVRVMPMNKVSFSEANVIMIVQDKIENLSIEDCCFYNSTDESTLVGNVTSGTNVTYTWQVAGLPTFNPKLQGQIVQLTFPAISTYEIILTAENLVSKVQKTIEVYTQAPIKGLQLIKPPNQVYDGQTVVFRAKVSQGSHITYEWRLCDIGWTTKCIKQISASDQFTHTFNSSGTYVLAVYAFNNVSSDTQLFPVSSFEIRCKPMALSHIGGSKRQEYRSRSIDLEVAVEVNCTRYPVDYMWKIYTDFPDMEKEKTLAGVNMEGSYLSIPPLSLETGNYYFQFTAEYLRTPVVVSIVYHVEVKNSSLIPIIEGGTIRTFSVSDEISLDAGRSYDPDMAPGDDPDLVYLWEIKDHLLQDVVGVSRSMSQKVLTIPSGTLNASTTYLAHLTVGKDGRPPATTTQKLNITATKVPLLQIHYITFPEALGVYNSYSSGRKIKMKSSCSNCKGPVFYYWQMKRGDGEPFLINDSISTTGEKKSNLVLKKGVLNDQYSYEVQLRVENPSKFNDQEIGFGSLTLQPNEPPKGGSCSVANNDSYIRALEDRLEVVCDGWYDPDDATNPPVTYEVYIEKYNAQSSADWYRLYSGSKKSGSYYIAPFAKEEETVILKVYVRDRMGGRTLALAIDILVKVKTPTGESMMGYLLESVNTKLPQIVLHKNSRELLQYCTIVSHLVIQGEKKGDLSEEDKEKQRLIIEMLIQSLNEVPFSDSQEEITDISYFLRKTLIHQMTLMTSILNLELQSAASKMILNLNQEITKLTHCWSNGALSCTKSSDIGSLADESLQLIMKYVRKMVEKFIETASPAYSIEDRAPENMLSIAFSLIRKVQEDDSLLVPLGGRKKRSATTINIEEEAYNLPDIIARACAQYLLVGESPFSFTENEMSCYAKRVTPGDVISYSQDEFSVELPPSILGFLDSDEVVSHTVTTQPQFRIQANPPVTSRTISVNFQHANGSEVKIENLDKSRLIQVLMPKRQDQSSDLDSPANQSRVFSPRESFKVHFDTNDSMLAEACGLNLEITGTVIKLGNESDYDTMSNLSLTAYLGWDQEAQWYKFDKKLEITYDTITAPNARHQDWTFFTLLCVDDDKKKPRDIYLTVTNENALHDVNVTVSAYIVACQYFDEVLGIWRQDGCIPTEASNRTHSVCLVNHLTRFGGSALVSPDDIDFSDLTELNLADNPVVVILVSVIAGVFIVVIFWARQSDLQDLHNISVVPLCGRDGVYKYEVVVVTGRKRGSGTSAHVGIKIYGSDGKSGARHLARLGAFQRNSEDSFLIASDVPLTNIQKIHIWHDNTGKHPSWYVSRVVIRDLQSNHKSFFLVNSWLSLTVEQGSLDKQVYTASPEELSNFGTVFSSETSRGFAERHLWLSIWDRPPRSRFTRVQRVVCCVTLLYSFMCANVMWYGLINHPEREAQALGLVKIGWQDFVIGILASIVVFPVNFIIIQIFRFSKVKVDAYDYGIKPGTAQTIEVEAQCDISQGGDSFIIYNDRKNSIQRLHRQDSSDSIMVPIEGKKWWSYDTILKWPENMPNDQRPESSQGHAGPLRKTPAIRPMKGPRATDSTEELILDDEMFTKSDREAMIRENNNIRSVRKTTSQTLSISESIAEVDEDEYLEKGSFNIPLKKLDQPRERSDSWGTTASRFTLSKAHGPASKPHLSPNDFNPRGEPKLDSDSGEVNQALLEIDTNIHESDQIEPRLLNKKKLSMNQCTTPIIDILKLDEVDHDATKEMLDETGDNADPNGLAPKSTLRKTRSKQRVNKRWAQIVIPPEYEQYKNDSYLIFDPEEEYDAESIIPRSDVIVKSRGNSLSSNGTTFSRFHQLMPASLTAATRCLLPHWCVYIAYSLCFILSGFSIIITILYGHAFGRDLALKWLLAFFISFLDSVFILEPLKVLALAVFISMITRGIQDEDEGIETRPLVEANERIKDVRMKPLGGFALLQAKEEGRKVQRMHRMLRHFCVYFIFIWISFFITYRAHNTSIYPVTQDVRMSFLGTSSTNDTSFYDIKHADQMWIWIQEVGLPAIYQKYNHGTNNQRILLGEARLRQVRGRPVKCHVSGSLSKFKAGHLLTRGCSGDPRWQEETGNYDLEWRLASNTTATWVYSTPSEALGEDYLGMVDSYPGGGYVQGLGRTLVEAEDTLQTLISSGWVDRSTRAVFLEATLYTLPSYLHTTVRILVEFPVTGGVFVSHDVQSFLLLNHVPGQVTALMIFIALLSLIWLYMAVVIVFGLRRHTYHYFLRFWNWMQITIAVMVFFVIVMYAYCTVVDTDAYSRYASGPKGFNSFFKSATCFRTWKAATGMLVFLATTWMVRLMRFIKPLSSYGKTISAASWRLLGCTIILLIFLLTFTQLGHLWFGSIIGVFRSGGSSFTVLVSFIRGHSLTTLMAMHEASPVMAGFFLFSFIASVMVVTMGLFMAVLNSTYKTIRLQNFYHTSIDMQDHEMIEFMIKRFKKYIGITKPKPAFRRVKFQGMPSISSRSSMSSRTGMSHSLVSSGSYDAFGLDALEEQDYLEELLERCVPTWNRMLEKLERVLWLDREVTRLEKAIVERLGTTIAKRSGLGLKHLAGLSKAAKVVGKVIGKGGSRCHRSNSESLMTDVRAKQIRDALNAELMEMEQKILADVETPSLPRKTMSFTEGRGPLDRKLHSSGDEGGVPHWPRSVNRQRDPEIGVTGGDRERDRERDRDEEHRYTQPSSYEPSTKVVTGRPPLQPKRFLNSAGPRRTAHELGLENRTREASSGIRRKGSAASSNASRARESSPVTGLAKETTKDAPKEAQRAYGTKLPRRDVKLPGVNLTRRPTSEQSERVKKNPDLPLPKYDS